MIKTIPFLFFSISILSNLYAQDDLTLLQNKYGDIVYSAIYSLPESQNQYLEVVGKEYLGVYYSPNYLATQIPNDVKQKLNKAFSNLSSNKALLKRIEYWVLCYHQFSHALTITSIEYALAAVYVQPETQNLFKYILTNRNMNSSVTALSVGATLSSAETNDIVYKTLNLLSDLEIKDQLSYFDNMFKTLDDLLK
ncbi:MAG TPA: hypothetical protein DF712_12420 [Balneola sp.]|jgi:hypothetical protein|nr:hypothetical protein [Bacteroidota bacterium]HCI70958.1 hypothetical protein [Balneola sp.]HCT53254.1 hypothetical protein [Balneola sp.]|tara:strand:- start:248 stop:832 length:585 start_codon:yes stop_codon:yes gene_type:complete